MQTIAQIISLLLPALLVFSYVASARFNPLPRRIILGMSYFIIGLSLMLSVGWVVEIVALSDKSMLNLVTSLGLLVYTLILQSSLELGWIVEVVVLFTLIWGIKSIILKIKAKLL